MNPFEMVLGIVIVGCIASVLRAKYGIVRNRHGDETPIRDPDADRLRDELRTLKERVVVLERIATDANGRSSSLEREIEALRKID